ncbi:tetratricopeptide repeat protein [Methylogaea oryzae]|uniref:tetratricopeptide repeat protein n=1 Tax=Methylogaea oryzae TaxID=1295382 RepID=UPI001C3F256D|nr:tetratricopeptide repeat protein [Methylogaea oryzae]
MTRIVVYLLALVGLAVLSVGCATALKGGLQPDERIGSPMSSEEARRADTMYQLLAGEVAGQKGQFGEALESYMKAARDSSDARLAERATQIALYAKQTDKALDAANLWLERDPENLAARKIVAMLLLKSGRQDEALNQLGVILQRADADAENTLVELVRLIGQELSKADAMRLMEQLAERFPQRAEVHYAYSLLAMEQGEVALARREVDKALRLHPDWGRGRILQAQLAARAGDGASAKAILEQALKVEPGSTHLRLVLAEQLMREENPKAAEQQFRRILRQEPDHEDAAFGLSMALLQQHRDDAARKTLMRLAEGSRWSAQAAYYLGLLESRRKQYEAALDWFEQVSGGALALEAQTNAVSSLVALNRGGEAVEKLRHLRKQFPQEALRFYLMEAELLTRDNDYAAAFDVLTEALQAMPQRPELLYTRSLVAERLDRLEVLEQDLNEILKQNPDDANALNALGYTLADKTNRYSEAQRLLARAVELKPEDPAILDSYGWLQYRLGNYDVAVDYLRRAYARNPDVEIAAHLGEVLWIAGERAEAKSVWRKAAKRAPDNEYIRRVMEQFKEAFE